MNGKAIGPVPTDPPGRAQVVSRGVAFMMVMAIAVGVVAGVGAWGFRMLIGLVQRQSASPRRPM
jgi:hypothetical protein